MKLIAVLALVIIYANLVLTKQIYVVPNSQSALATSPCGSTLNSACANIKVALASAATGDIILLQAGVYLGPLNVGLEINIAGIQIIGVAQATILDLGLSGHAFLVLQPNVVFVNLIIRNGVSLDASLAGAITVRLNVAAISAAVSLQNVLFKDIRGGALLIDSSSSSSYSTNSNSPSDSSVSTGSSGSTSSSSTSTSSGASGILLQAQLLRVVFVNVSLKPSLMVLGNIRVQLSECQFQNNGMDGFNSSDSTSTSSSGSGTSSSGSSGSSVDGAAIFASANVLGLKVSISLRSCVFVGNRGLSIINIGSSVSGDELIFVDVNTFIDNVATTAIIKTNPTLSLVSCLGCNTVWSNNQAPLLCDVLCSLLGISVLCPGSCPGALAGVLGGIGGIL